ncbi:MAG: endonuclease MutS2, partial [Vallitaleaceae bacterium]|nr:endonuclease MutS2 [Vallitaleaceae bacterium]
VINEAKEIQKILAKLSYTAATYHNELEENIELLTHLDFVFAKANYSMNTRCSCPIFNTNYEIYLEKARHPLLDPETVVPTTIFLGKEFTTLVVTGPNTGGKTVTLKTLGLLSLMGQSGLHIPAFDGAKLTLLDQIFADIGDEQSIEQSLSTFSSHMKNITYILEHVTDRSLVLFDELGAGTDPTEGAALAMAILDNLRTSRILTAATTHYSELKVYALSTEGVENASCEFDVTTLRPTYRLLIGIPGKSNAFAISKRLGLSDVIIDEAKALLEGKAVRFEDLITDLETNKKTAILEQERAKQYRKEAESLKDQVETQKAQIAAQKKRMLEEAKNEAMKILDDAKAEADQIIRKMNELVRSGSSFNMADLEEQRTQLREKINSASKKATSTRKTNQLDARKLTVGDKVFVNTLGQNGTVVSVS